MKVQNGHNVKVHYKGTLPDGTVFDNSYVRGAPLDFEVGSRKLIRGFSDALLGMSKGQTKNVTIPVEMAYGPVNPDAVQPVPRNAFAEEFEFEIGGTVQGNGPGGKFLARIHDIIEEEQTIVLDMNHPLAGKELNFEIELLEVMSEAKAPAKKTSKKKTPKKTKTPKDTADSENS